MRLLKREPGVLYFTLVEVIIVLAIIAIILAIAIPALIEAQKNAKCRKYLGDMQSVVTECTGATVPYLNDVKFEECLKKAKKTLGELRKDTLCFDTTKNTTLWNGMKTLDAKVTELIKEDSLRWSKYKLKY
jgi:prepilin-type N-terminal cleavage/methylation domain-containing protein